jgi:SAM-dependent methyltransferase
MTGRPASPYLAPGFYDQALADGRHRAIVGGRWDETARVQMRCLLATGLRPDHHLLDIGCGALRLGHLAVRFLEPRHYWGTDASPELMHRGWQAELTDADRARLPLSQLVADADFAFPGIPDTIDMAIAFAVFTHLPPAALDRCLATAFARFPRLSALLFTVFLAPEGTSGPYRQPDGVVTHPDRPPRHHSPGSVAANIAAAGLTGAPDPAILPRGQVLWTVRRAP